MIDPLDYFDYRKFLRDYYEDRKKEHFYFSYRFLASKLGVDAGNIVKIIQGERHASRKFISKFVEVARLNKKETDYFTTLVQFGKSKSERDSKILFEKLLSIKNAKPEKIQPHHYEYYQKWYHTAVFSALYYFDFTGNYKDLATHLNPPISVKQVKDSIRLLERLGFITKDSSGKYFHAKKLISTGDVWRGLAVQNFQEETAKLALHSLENDPREIKDFSSVSLTVSKDDLDKIREITREYRKAILKIAHESETPDRVYHLNVQLFPMTNVK